MPARVPRLPCRLLRRCTLWFSIAWVALVVATSAATAAPARDRIKALAPDEALASFQLDAGLRIDVVEGRGYPEPLDGKPAPNEGRVALLEDTDGDGRFDKRTEFATGLSYPNGITVWRGGVFVTCA